MTTINTTINSSSSRINAYLDCLQMITGAGLIAFMWSHMMLVASVNLGAAVMNAIAWFFEATYMAQIGGPLIGLTMLLHFILTARKMPFTSTNQNIIWRHVKMLNHADSWLWIIQILTAIIILIMGSIHIWTVLIDLPITAQKSALRIQSKFWLPFYLILLPIVELHVGIGFYRIGIKWNFIKQIERKKFKRTENILTVTMIIIGLITIIRFATLAI